MIDESLLKSNFIGRDGFRWWIGQVAPGEAQGDQSNGGGWGNRKKVRILGYHPYSETELKNEDLPWAQILLPTTSGSGGGGCSTSTKLKQGDVVFGFFLDGDNAQIPVVVGCFGRTADIETGSEPYVSPFSPFTGYTDRVKKPNGPLKGDESNEDNSASQKSPRDVPPDIINKLNQANPDSVEVPYFTGVGKTIVFANSCGDTALSGMTAEIDNLLQKVNAGLDGINNLSLEISKSVDKITGIMNVYIGQMMKSLYTDLIPILNEGLKLLYKLVYGAVLAATGSDRLAHLAGVAAQTAMVGPVKSLEDGLQYIAGEVVNTLGDSVKELLTDVLSNVDNLVTCASSQFAGAILNNTMDGLLGSMGPLLDGVSKLLSLVGYDVEGGLRSGIGSLQAIGGLFSGGQSQGKCSGIAKEWVIGQGVKDPGCETALYSAILENMNAAISVGRVAEDAFQAKYGTWDIFSGNSAISNSSCYTGPPIAVRPPQVRIFGGGGTGATAIAILGAFVDVIGDVTDITNIQTASVLGVEITSGGSNYTTPPFVEFYDESKQGYGAVGRTIIDSDSTSSTFGQVLGVYMASIGENYPVANAVPEYTTDSNIAVIGVEIANSGTGYVATDTASDNYQNDYKLVVENGKIISAQVINTKRIQNLPTITVNTTTGRGAVLKSIVGRVKFNPPNNLTRIVDCPT